MNNEVRRMKSILRKDQASKNVECHTGERNSRTSLNEQDISNSFNEAISLDEVDFQRIGSPTGSTYSDARSSVTSFIYKDGSFGDTHSTLSETNSKSERDILLLGESIMKNFFRKKTFTTVKTFHVDIPPEKECTQKSGEYHNNDILQIHETDVLKSKISVEKNNHHVVIKNDSSKETGDTQVKQPVSPKEIRSGIENYRGEFSKDNHQAVFEENSNNEIYGTRVKQPASSRNIRSGIENYQGEFSKDNHQAVFDDDSNNEIYGTRVKQPASSRKIRSGIKNYEGKRVRWSPDTNKDKCSRRNSYVTSSIEYLDQFDFRNEQFFTFTNKPKTSLKTPPDAKVGKTTHKSTIESFVQTENLIEEEQTKSKFKTVLLEWFLSCVRCFM